MRRPFAVWIAFAVSLAVAFVAMGWISASLWRLDHSEEKARQKADMEERVRLALWRMDSAMATLLGREGARPYFAYQSFYSPQRSYTRMFAEIQPGEVLLPSPLLRHVPRHIYLHFQINSAGIITSPQAPTGNMRDLAETGYVSHDRLTSATQRLRELAAIVDPAEIIALLESDEESTPTLPVVIAQEQLAQQPGANQMDGMNQSAQQIENTQMLMNSIEYTNRRNISNQNKQSGQPELTWTQGDTPVQQELEGTLIRPLWVGREMMLARKIRVEEDTYVQGCWLDWPGIRKWLLGEIRDQFPRARLIPVPQASRLSHPPGASRLLAALPVLLDTGLVSLKAIPCWTPLRIMLLLAWGSMFLAALAVALLIRSILSLSERRGAFVSAVTHELRTPLTSLRIYSEMLAEDMVSSPEKRREYLDTLHTEAERLHHLVENVLAYSRLERTSSKARIEPVIVGDLGDRILERTAKRAEQAGMCIALDIPEDIFGLTLKIDASAVERILFNLIDNACKYAASADNKKIRIEARRAGEYLALRVYDHGPGIAPVEAERLFKPFRKSAKEAASSAPGVGLGLALSRRLARAMKGNLTVECQNGDGACFVLTLPIAL